MDYNEIIEKITEKKDFSKIPKEDVLRAYKKFEKRQCSEEEKIRLTRDLLRKIYSAFTSKKLLSIKDKEEEWFLRKHLSTRERLGFYSKLYEKLFFSIPKCSVIDLGCGINGFSYKYFPKKTRINYVGVEAVGQLSDLLNFYFNKNQINARVIHESLFEMDKIKKIIEAQEKPRVIFLFKVIDSLEMLERDYSKFFLKELSSICDKIIVSFATRSMKKQDKFKVNRKWIINFIKDNFELLEDFYLGNERYLIFIPNSKFK